MELALSICLGIGLAAACGMRVFVPLVGVSAAAIAGHLDLAENFQWLGTWPALVCLLTATILEIGAYYVPWLDNLLDTAATPAAVIAGTLATASVVTDMSPLMKWSLAVIAGGGTAGVIQSATVALRGTSSLTSGGLTNWAVATLELIGSLLATILSLLLPMLAALVAGLVAIVMITIARRRPPRSGCVADGNSTDFTPRQGRSPTP
jgi:hypothetical protein